MTHLLLYCLPSWPHLPVKSAKEALYGFNFYTITINSPGNCTFWDSNNCRTEPPFSCYLPLGSSPSSSCIKSISRCNVLNQHFPSTASCVSSFSFNNVSKFFSVTDLFSYFLSVVLVFIISIKIKNLLVLVSGVHKKNILVLLFSFTKTKTAWGL